MFDELVGLAMIAASLLIIGYSVIFGNVSSDQCPETITTDEEK